MITATQASSGKVCAGGVTYTGYAVGYLSQDNVDEGAKTIQGGSLNTQLTFTAHKINEDVIGIADPLLFSEGDYTTVQQYYVIEASINNTPVSYLYTKDYRVTRAYNNVTVKYNDRVGAELQTDGSYKISWTDILGKLEFKYLKEGNIPETVSTDISPTQFKLEVTEAGSGSASVNPDEGIITTSTNFNQQYEYITLVFYRKASGADGEFGTNDDKPESEPFLEFRFLITDPNSSST